MRDQTASIADFAVHGRGVDVRFANSPKTLTYKSSNALYLAPSSSVTLRAGDRLLVGGEIWSNVTEVVFFAGLHDSAEAWARLFYTMKSGEERWSLRSAVDVEIRSSAHQDKLVAQILRYWREAARTVDELSSRDARTRRNGHIFSMSQAHEQLSFVDPASALAAYLSGANHVIEEPLPPVILPFESNEDQRDAVEKALRNQVSVIDGPPGTGKTETILNLVANILLVPGQSVGVVSFGNAAVDNVKEKMDATGLGFLVARLGRGELVDAFLERQAHRSNDLRKWLDGPCGRMAAQRHTESGVGGRVPSDSSLSEAEQLRSVEGRLLGVWRMRQKLAKIRNLKAAYALEAAHFERRIEGEEVPELSGLPLLQKNADWILDYLAEVTLQPKPPGGIAGLLVRLRRYLR